MREEREESKDDAQDNESGGFKSNSPKQVTASRRSKVEQGDEWRERERAIRKNHDSQTTIRNCNQGAENTEKSDDKQPSENHLSQQSDESDAARSGMRERGRRRQRE